MSERQQVVKDLKKNGYKEVETYDTAGDKYSLFRNKDGRLFSVTPLTTRKRLNSFLKLK